MPPGLRGAPASVSAKTFPYAEPHPAHAPEPDAAGIEVPLFSADRPLWPNGCSSHRAPDVCSENQQQKNSLFYENNHKHKKYLTLFDMISKKQRQHWCEIVL